MNSTNESHSLQAWTVDGDFVPTLYVQGEIATNGEKPMVDLEYVEPQGINDRQLLLKMSPDVYSPDGSSRLRINNYERPLETLDQYSSVLIQGAKGNIELEVERRNRD